MQMPFPTLVDRLAHHAVCQPSRRVFSFLRDGNHADALTYAELDERARHVAVAVLDATTEVRGEQPRALLLLPQSLAFIDALFGCFYAAVCAVPAHAPTAAQSRQAVTRLRAIAADARPHVVLTTQDRLAMRDSVPELEGATWLAIDALPTTSSTHAFKLRTRSDDLAILQYSSGSTGDPRGVMVSHGNLIHNEALIHEAFEHSPSTIVIGWLPFQHDMGLIGNVLQPVYAGAECLLMTTTAFLKRPLRWLEEISRHRATSSGAPNFAYESCVRHAEQHGCGDLDLSSWTLAYVGAEPVRATTLERFVQMFSPHGFAREALYPCYGLAEATLMVTGGIKAEPFRALTFDRPDGRGPAQRVSCGAVRFGQRLAIVDPSTGRRVASGDGEVWIQGPSVARGYFGRPDATRSTFGARLEGEDGMWMRSGDIGRLVDGELYVTGRLKDVAVVNGVKHAGEDIEYTIESVCERPLRPNACAVFAIDDGEREDLVVIQEIDRGASAPWNDLAARLAQAVVNEHRVHADVVSLVRAGSIPRTTSGKVRRSACRELFARGAFDEVHRYTRPRS